MSESVRSERAEYWQGILDEFQHSGQTVQLFCAEKGVSAASFYQWRRRLLGDGECAKQSLVPVNLLPAVRLGGAVPVQILTPQGFVVRVDSCIAAEALSELLRSIESSAARGGTC